MEKFFFNEDLEFDPEFFGDDEDWEADDDWDLDDDEEWEDFFTEEEMEQVKKSLIDKRKKVEESNEWIKKSVIDKNKKKDDSKKRLLAKKKPETKKNDENETIMRYVDPGITDIDSDDEKKISDENLFFFTDNDFFRSSRFQYTSQGEQKKGFVFALFNAEPAFNDDEIAYENQNNKTNYLSSFHETEKQNIDAFGNYKQILQYRTLKNLGSELKEVRPYDEEHRTGIEVTYHKGDECVADPLQNYTSRIRYQCSPES